MITYNWSVVNMNRLTSDNFVVTVHFSVTATDGDYSANTYGTISYTQKPDESFVPYEELTQEIVVGWCQESLGKDTVEESLATQIDALKNPTQVSGTPWGAAA